MGGEFETWLPLHLLQRSGCGLEKGFICKLVVWILRLKTIYAHKAHHLLCHDFTSHLSSSAQIHYFRKICPEIQKLQVTLLCIPRTFWKTHRSLIENIVWLFIPQHSFSSLPQNPCLDVSTSCKLLCHDPHPILTRLPYSLEGFSLNQTSKSQQIPWLFFPLWNAIVTVEVGSVFSHHSKWYAQLWLTNRLVIDIWGSLHWAVWWLSPSCLRGLIYKLRRLNSVISKRPSSFDIL